jgi:hypothetical protein
MACALTYAGNPTLAARFYARAGTGEWTACQQGAPVPGTPAGYVAPTGGVAPVAPGGRQPLTP